LGSFISSLLLRLFRKKTSLFTNCNRSFNFNWIALISDLIEITYPNIIICFAALLWNANSFVTQISNASCERTTHLTGLLPIWGDISGCFLETFSQRETKRQYQTSITIITFFFLQVD
jgi:hypothetical protein